MHLTDQNYVKLLLREGKRVTGAWAQAASNITTEILGEAGFDVVMIDMEHGPGDVMTLITQIQSLKGLPAVPFVRAPWNDFVIIKRILDAGAFGLLVPYVNTRQEVEDAVRAIRYPTEGIRGVAGSPRAAHFANNSIEYFRKTRDELFLMTAVETPEAMDNLDDILEVDGLDGIFVGPMDLATSMGHLGDPGHAEVRKAIATIEAKVTGSNKILSTVAGSWEDAHAKYERGYQLLMLMSDTVTLGKIARDAVMQFTLGYPNR